MGQRLGIAAALLGDPQTLVLDEPSNGLDPEGILWIRTLLKNFAADGRTVFLSSHLMSEIALTAEQLVVVGRGRLIADASVAEVVARASENAAVRVVTPDADALAVILTGEGARSSATTAEPSRCTGSRARASASSQRASRSSSTSSRRARPRWRTRSWP